MSIQSILKKLPPVERVLEDERIAAALNPFSRKGITAIVRSRIDSQRELLLSGEDTELDGPALLKAVSDGVVGELEKLSSGRLSRVINATGVVLHTNLGRAVLGDDVRSAIDLAASGYTDLEMDARSGERVHRDRRVSKLLALLSGSEMALVLNNAAAAVLLAVHTFCRNGAVAVSRGELVEIGGSFRLPEILESAAGRVIEVGTTNRTHLKDYKRACDEGASLLLKVHASNYRIVGYTNEVSLGELVELGRTRDIPVMYDQGNGMLVPAGTAGLEGEEDISSLVRTGVDILSCSGDKVLGGPQAGIVLGSTLRLAMMRANHLSRALRVDKLTLAGLESVLLSYWRGETGDIPALGMISRSAESLGERAASFAESVREKAAGAAVAPVEGESSIGGGSFPINPLASVLVAVTIPDGKSVRLSEYLRGCDPPVLSRIKGDTLYIDLRTVGAREEETLRKCLIKGIDAVSGRE